MSEKNKNLYYLDELSDYKVASDYCDVRGWEVKEAENRTIGKVDGLLVNKAAERVVYLDVEVDKTLIKDDYKTYQSPASDGVHGFLNKNGDDHLIIPVGMVSLDRKNKKVITNNITFNTFEKVSRFSKGAAIGRDYEIVVLRNYVAEDASDDTYGNNKFYDRSEFDNNANSLSRD